MTRGSNPTTVGLLALIAGVLFGLLTAATAGFDFLAGWLVLAYLLVGALVLLNVSPPKQRVRRLAEQAVEADRGERATEDVIRQMESVPVVLFVGTNVVLFCGDHRGHGPQARLIRIAEPESEAHDVLPRLGGRRPVW
jgi:hypothetical protein